MLSLSDSFPGCAGCAQKVVPEHLKIAEVKTRSTPHAVEAAGRIQPANAPRRQSLNQPCSTIRVIVVLALAIGLGFERFSVRR
jgi:hypothetical protein